jgi:hypothetical protein
MKTLLSLFILLGCMTLVTAAQNIGIGTNTPTRAKLEVHGAADATSAIFGGESSGISLQRNWPGIGFNTYYNGGNRYLSNGFASKLYQDPGTGYTYWDIYPDGNTGLIAPSGSRAFTISPAGFIGIGSGTPNGHMQFGNIMSNRKIVLWESANNSNQFFGFGINSGTLRFQVAGSGDAHRFYSGLVGGSTLLMTIQGDKTVIIGDGTNEGRLGINFPTPPEHALSIRQTEVVGGGKGILLQEVLDNSTWEINAGTGGGGGVLRLAHNGTNVGYFNNAGDYNTFSDSRLKSDVQNIPGILDRFMQLRPVSYEMNNNNPNHQRSLGFIAQEVKLLFPGLVSMVDNFSSEKGGLETVYSMNYTRLGVIAIKAIQEQQVKIDQLQQQIDELKRSLAGLK